MTWTTDTPQPDRLTLFAESGWVHGKRYRVVGIFTTDAAANEYMTAHPDTGVIGEFGPFILVAEMKAGQ